MGNSTYMAFQAGASSDQPQRDPKTPNPYLSGLKPDEVAAFTTQQEMIDAMSDKRYSAAGLDGDQFREAVRVMIANSDFGGATLNGEEVLTSNEAKAAKRKADWLAKEDADILKEHVQSLMNDPRYETSTLFRRQVREQILANQELIEKTIPSTKGPTKINGRIQFTGEEYAEVQAGLRKEREDKLKADAKDAAEAAAKRAAAPFVDVLGGNDDEGSEE